MTRIPRSLPILLALAALAPAASAQGLVPVRPVDQTVRYVGTYRFADHSWSAGARAGTRVLYNCTTPGNYWSSVGNSFATNANHLWIDEGRLADTNAVAIDQVNGFDFAYCSTDIDPTMNSSSIRVVFYDDYIPCTAPPAALCDYTITGLPLSTSGNTTCWSVGVDLEGGFECSTDLGAMFRTAEAGVINRNFGWAFGANPSLTLMNDTGPILDLPCAQPVGWPGCGTGNQNSFYWDDPSGYWSGCHWFGGVPYASFSMKLYGGALSSFAYGHTSNTMRLSSTDFGAGFTVVYTVTGHGAGNALYLLASPATGSISLPAGELVVSTNFYPGIPFPMSHATGTLAIMIPSSVTVVYAQAAETTGPATVGALVALSNGLYLTDSASGGTEAGIEIEHDFEVNAPCPGGGVRLKVRGWRRKTTGRGTQTVRVYYDPPTGPLVTDVSYAPGCVQGKLTTPWKTRCFDDPTMAFKLWYQDCDGAVGGLTVPAGAAVLNGCPPASVNIGDGGLLGANALNGSGWSCNWASSNPAAVSVGPNGAWSANKKGTAWMSLTCSRVVNGESEIVKRSCKIRVN